MFAVAGSQALRRGAHDGVQPLQIGGGDTAPDHGGDLLPRSSGSDRIGGRGGERGRQGTSDGGGDEGGDESGDLRDGEGRRSSFYHLLNDLFTVLPQ